MDKRIVQTKLNLLRARSIKRVWPIEGWQMRTVDYAGPDNYTYEAEWQPLQTEAGWQAGKTLFLSAQVQRPSDAPEDDLYLDFDIQYMVLPA